MKKIFNYLLVGAMVVAGQSMVFANTGEMKAEIKATPISEIASVQKPESVKMMKIIKEMDSIPASIAVPAQVLTPEMEAELKADMEKFEQEKITEICKVLDLDIKDMKDKSLGEVLEMLTEEQMNKLAEKDVVAMATPLTASTEAITVEMTEINKIEK